VEVASPGAGSLQEVGKVVGEAFLQGGHEILEVVVWRGERGHDDQDVAQGAGKDVAAAELLADLGA